MESISSKSEVSTICVQLKKAYQVNGMDSFLSVLHSSVLKKKVRFPLLEFLSKEILVFIPEESQISIADKIISMRKIGSYVLAGIILQARLLNHFSESVKKTIEYMIDGNEWYVCDIIGERVLGVSLLMNPELTITELKKLSQHSNKWMIRSVGVAVHYAVKKGLKKNYVEAVFQILLENANTTDFHTKKGIGWGAKTIAKFYPDIIAKYQNDISQNTEIKTWFKTKIKIGLGRSSKYAGKYSG